MKTLVRLLLAGIVFVTPTVAVAEATPVEPLCRLAEVPFVAQCVQFGQLMVFA
jgi:hypothetical protein